MPAHDFGPDRGRAHPLRAGLSKLPSLIFDDGSDPFNRCCSRIAVVMLAGTAAIYLETLR